MKHLAVQSWSRGGPMKGRRAARENGHVRLQPNYMATNELPIRRIYCLVLSQELIKSTQLKAAVRETWVASGPSIRLIHDCQLK